MRSFSLLIGFILMFSFPVGQTAITVFPLGGFALILFAIMRMEKMESVFTKAKKVLFFAIPVAAVLLGLQIYDTATIQSGAWFNGVYFAVRLTAELCELATMFFIYAGVKVIGSNAEIPSLEKQATRNTTLMLIYFAIEIILNCLKLFTPSVFVGFEFILMYPFVFGYVWHALNIWMAYTLLTKITVSHT
jgi:hypothetical protein